MNKSLKTNSKNTFPKINLINITTKGLLLEYENEQYFLSFSRVPQMLKAKLNDILNFENDDYEIWWEKLDISLEIDCLKHPEKYPLIMI